MEQNGNNGDEYVENGYETPPPISSERELDSQNPHQTWQKLKSKQRFSSYRKEKSTNRPYDPSTCTRIVVISDTHGKHRQVKLPRGDILVHGGDFSKSGEKKTIANLSEFFGDLLRLEQFQHVICIAGNHELTFHTDHYEKIHSYFHPKPMDCSASRTALTNCVYLEDETHVVNGLNFFGSPWTPLFYDWAFNLPRGYPIRQKWREIPTSTDVLITHGPPLGRGDEVFHFGKVGCFDLLAEVQQRIQPKIHIFGHIHEGYGISSDGTTLFVNASSVSKSYQVTNPCIVIDIPHDKSEPVVVVEPGSCLSSEELILWFKEHAFTRQLAPFLEQMENPLKVEDLLMDSTHDLCEKLKIHEKSDISRLMQSKLIFHADCYH